MATIRTMMKRKEQSGGGWRRGNIEVAALVGLVAVRGCDIAGERERERSELTCIGSAIPNARTHHTNPPIL